MDGNERGGEGKGNSSNRNEKTGRMENRRGRDARTKGPAPIICDKLTLLTVNVLHVNIKQNCTK